MATTTSVPTVKRHPIRGAIWGFFFGIGLSLVLVDRAVIALGTLTPWVIALGCLVAGVLWGLFAPAKGPKGGQPVIQQPPAAAFTPPPAAPVPPPPAAPSPPPASPPPAGGPGEAGGAGGPTAT